MSTDGHLMFKNVLNHGCFSFCFTCIYIFDTRSEFSLNRTIIFSVPQAFTRSSTMTSSGVRGNVHLNTKLELCWKILIFMKWLIFSLTEYIFPRPQAFASPSDMASSGVWENVFLATTPTFDGVCGMLWYIILDVYIAKFDIFVISYWFQHLSTSKLTSYQHKIHSWNIKSWWIHTLFRHLDHSTKGWKPANKSIQKTHTYTSISPVGQPPLHIKQIQCDQLINA